MVLPAGVYKIVGMLRTHAFKLFSENFNIFSSPAFIMTGRTTNFDVVVHGFFKFVIPLAAVNVFAEIKKIKDLNAPFALFFYQYPTKIMPVIRYFESNCFAMVHFIRQ